MRASGKLFPTTLPCSASLPSALGPQTSSLQKPQGERGHRCKNPHKHWSLLAPLHFYLLQSRAHHHLGLGLP